MKSNSSIEDFRESLREYMDRFRRPNLPPLEVSQLYELFPGSENPPEEIGAKWPDEWPNGWKKGVYLIFGAGGSLLYIGKASMNNAIGARLGQYFRYSDDEKRSCEVMHSWIKEPRYVLTIAVPDEMPFESPALEEYLIGALQPIGNIKGLTGK